MSISKQTLLPHGIDNYSKASVALAAADRQNTDAYTTTDRRQTACIRLIEDVQKESLLELI
jgi:hypothetical protein